MLPMYYGEIFSIMLNVHFKKKKINNKIGANFGKSEHFEHTSLSMFIFNLEFIVSTHDERL